MPAEVTTRGKGSRCGEEEETPRSLQLLNKPRAAHAGEGERGEVRWRKRGKKRERERKKKGCSTSTGKLQVDSTYEAKICQADWTVFGGSTGNKSVSTVGSGGLQQLRHTRGERTSCRRTTVDTVEHLPARLVLWN